jgi:hypothetical protein
MATAPFGESFGDPRRYMGQSPLAEVGKAAKTFLTGYALKESGFTDYLNSLGKKPVQGAVAPVAPQAGASPVAPPQPNAPAMLPMAPQTFAPAPESQEMPQDIGEQILNGTWTGFPSAPTVPTGPTSLKNPTDFNPLAPDASNQFAVSGNDYQQIPGYGKLQNIAGQFMGMG